MVALRRGWWGNSVLMSERAGLATKTLSHEAAQRKTLWSFVSWCLSGEILLNTLLPHFSEPCSRQGFVIGYALHSGRRTGELSHTANCSIRLLTQMLNTLQEATAMANTFRARRGRSSLG